MITKIKDIMTTQGFTNVVMADKMGISKQAFGKMINADSLTTTTLAKIADALNVPLWQLFVSPEEVTSSDQRKGDFCAFVRYKDIHYTADTLQEFDEIYNEIKSICSK